MSLTLPVTFAWPSSLRKLDGGCTGANMVLDAFNSNFCTCEDGYENLGGLTTLKCVRCTGGTYSTRGAACAKCHSHRSRLVCIQFRVRFAAPVARCSTIALVLQPRSSDGKTCDTCAHGFEYAGFVPKNFITQAGPLCVACPHNYVSVGGNPCQVRVAHAGPVARLAPSLDGVALLVSTFKRLHVQVVLWVCDLCSLAQRTRNRCTARTATRVLTVSPRSSHRLTLYCSAPRAPETRSRTEAATAWRALRIASRKAVALCCCDALVAKCFG
jgi:hypothetical protein